MWTCSYMFCFVLFCWLLSYDLPGNKEPGDSRERGVGTLRPLSDSFAAETPPSRDLGVLGPAARRSQAWFVFGESPFPRGWPALPIRPASRRWGPAHRRRVLSSHSRRAVHCSPLQLASAARLCSWVPLGSPAVSAAGGGPAPCVDEGDCTSRYRRHWRPPSAAPRKPVRRT